MKPTLRSLLRVTLLTLGLTFFQNYVVAQLSIDDSATPEELVTSLVGEGVTVSDITMDCPTGAFGFFECVDCNVGIGSGILLTSGYASLASGPNNTGSAAGDNGASGDPDLDMIAGVLGTSDACALEFDLTVTSDTIRFNYSFGSEEYMEWVGSFNDVFAFYISGPGIVGSENMALIPGTGTAVSINNVNLFSFPEFYVDNGDGYESPYSDDDYYIQYDGFTTLLEAKRNVIPCETYHLKMVIADDLDWSYDSGVFIEAGSLSSPGVTLTYETEINAYPDVIEGCNEGLLTFALSFAPIDTFIVNLEVAGTATISVDYEEFETELVFLPGDTLIEIPIIALEDGIDEGMETIIISVDLGCIAGVGDSLVINVWDALPLTVSNDTMICPDETAFLSVSGAETYSWTPVGTLSDPTADFTEAYPTEPTTYTVEGTLASCVNTAEVFVDIQSPSADAGIDTTIFYGETANLDASGGVEYSWSPTTGLSDPNSENPFATPLTTTTYTVTVTTAIGCEFTDEVTVSTDAMVGVPNAFSPNEDGINDGFTIIVRGQLATYHLLIYNRWGEAIYETNDFTKSWNGKIEDDGQPMGAYIYVLNYTDLNGESFMQQGNFTLVR